jgi:hypothetical protein
MEFSSSQTKEKKKNIKKKKTIKKKKNAEKGGSFPSSSRVALSFLAPTLSSHFWLPCCPLIFGSRVALSFLAPFFALSLLPFCFKCFFLASSSSQA